MDHQRKRYRPQVRQVINRRRKNEGQQNHLDVDADDDNRKLSREHYIGINGQVDIAGDAEPLLPAYAQDFILERLPARQRCQIRCVCKAWNALPARPLRATGRDSFQEELWFVMARPPKYEYRDFNWRFRAWSSCSLDMKKQAGEGDDPFFRPPLPNPHHSKLSSLLGTGPNYSHLAYRLKGLHLKRPPVANILLCSAGGLMSAIVCRPGAEDCFDIIVFNCLTGCVKVLPPTLNTGDVDMQRSMLGCSLHMTLDDQDPSCYYVLITGCGYPRHFEVFESRSTCWKVVDNPYVPFKSGQVLRDFAATHLSSSELSVADADFWWLESVADFEESDEDGGEDHDDRHCSEDSLCCLLGYHARHDAWTSLLLPPTPCDNVCRGLNLFMKYKGRLLLGEKLEDADGTILGFGVWEVQPTSVEAGTWVEVARTPEHLHPALNSRSWDCDLSADGGLFWMTFCNGSHRSFRPPLVFDMARNSWYSLPLTKTSRKFGCICVNRPSFSTSV